MQSKSNLINSHNEWDKLREVIVGTAEGTMPTLIWNKPGEVPKDVKDKAYSLAKEAAPKWFYDEVSEDLQKNAEADIQELTDKYIAKIDRILEAKEKEIMTI